MVGLTQIASILFAWFGRRLQPEYMYHMPINMYAFEDNEGSTCCIICQCYSDEGYNRVQPRGLTW